MANYTIQIFHKNFILLNSKHTKFIFHNLLDRSIFGNLTAEAVTLWEILTLNRDLSFPQLMSTKTSKEKVRHLDVSEWLR